jgi:hypothetical protein
MMVEGSGYREQGEKKGGRDRLKPQITDANT